MIRGNYSLSSEIRKNELKHQSKIQQRQKRQHMMAKLADVDPVRLYRQIERLERENDNPKRLRLLREDWAFIRKNGLHKEKVGRFLEQLEAERMQKERDAARLWGSKSVFWNPELNPLGKVPIGYDNVTKPVKQRTKYPVDPRVEALGVTLPPGPPPRFYKEVFNTERPAPPAAEPVPPPKKQRV